MSRRLRSARSGALIVMILVFLASCGSGNGGQAPGPSSGASATPIAGSMPVVVTLPVFLSMVQAVGGNHVSVSSIVPAGVDPHSYQPTPSDVREVADAKAIFVNGAGLETWMDGLIKSAGGSNAPVYTLSEGLNPVVQTASGTQEGNPHFWLDPTNAIHYVQRIEQGLSERDPEHAADYQANAARYIGQIQDFDTWAKVQIEKIPVDQRKIVTFHDAFPYFGQHFGLSVIGVIEKSPGRDPSAKELADLVDQIKSEDVKAIFNEPQFNPKLADSLARDAGIKTLTLYSASPPKGDGYIEMMRKNITTVVEGLS